MSSSRLEAMSVPGASYTAFVREVQDRVRHGLTAGFGVEIGCGRAGMSAPTISPVVKELSQEQIGRYADAVNDHNPIHVDEAFAQSTPFGGTIAHGMLVLASISEMMAAALGGRWTRSREWLG